MISKVPLALHPAGRKTFYGGTIPFGLPDAILPFTCESHDLAHRLWSMVELDGPWVNLNTTKIANCIKTFLQLMPVSLATFSKTFMLRQSEILVLLENPEHWSKISLRDKRIFFKLFLWLNLPAHERQTVFEWSNAEAVKRQIWLPSKEILSEVLVSEIISNCINISEFAKVVARHNDETLVVNAIYNVFPEELLTPEYLLCYNNIWNWLRKPKLIRMKVLQVGTSLSSNTTSQFKVLSTQLASGPKARLVIQNRNSDLNPRFPINSLRRPTACQFVKDSTLTAEKIRVETFLHGRSRLVGPFEPVSPASVSSLGNEESVASEVDQDAPSSTSIQIEIPPIQHELNGPEKSLLHSYLDKCLEEKNRDKEPSSLLSGTSSPRPEKRRRVSSSTF